MKYAPTRINAEPASCNADTGSLSHKTPKIRETTGASRGIVEAFERLMCLSPQYHVRT